MKLYKAALQWWNNKSPEEWSGLKHSRNPTINCEGKFEKRLAKAIAKRWLKEYNEQERLKDPVEPLKLSPGLYHVILTEETFENVLSGCFFKMWGNTYSGEYVLLCVAAIEAQYINSGCIEITVEGADILTSGVAVRWRIDDESRPDIWISGTAGTNYKHPLLITNKYQSKGSLFNLNMKIGTEDACCSQ